jgi:acetyltransferase-like isoleucine patch superfamily enzyme
MESSCFYTKDILANGSYPKSIGEFSYGAPTVMEWGEGAKLTIGKFCSIAEKVTIFLGGNHKTEWISTYPFSALSELWEEAQGIVGHPATKGDVTIGNDVWIGYGVTILSGVTIGDGAVIGANSVIAKDIEPYSIVAGNPFKVIKKRFSEEQIETLLKIQWWEWDISKIRRALPYLCSDRIDTFLGFAHD